MPVVAQVEQTARGHRNPPGRQNPKRVLLRDVRAAEADYARAVMRYGENNMLTTRLWQEWKDLQRAYEAQTGKPLYKLGNPRGMMGAPTEVTISPYSGGGFSMKAELIHGGKRYFSESLIYPTLEKARAAARKRHPKAKIIEAVSNPDRSKLFKTEVEAEAFLENLRRKGIPARSQYKELKRGGGWEDRWKVTWGGKTAEFWRQQREARQEEYRARRAAELGEDFNPKKGTVGELAEAQALYEEFQGKAPHQVTELDEPGEARAELAALGWLIELVIQPRSVSPEALAPKDVKEAREAGEEWAEIAKDHGVPLVVVDFKGDKVCLASNAGGSQLYAIGGRQDLTGLLGKFSADDSKDFIELGYLISVTYLTRKSHSNFEPTDWEHTLSEETGDAQPIAFWNRLQQRIYFEGGAYWVEGAGIRN